MATVSGLFDNYDDASRAVNELETAGIPRDDISIVANNSDEWYGRDRTDVDESGAAEGAGTGAGLGALAGGAGGLLTGLGIMAIPGVGPVVAAGWLAATAVGAIAGAAVGGAAGGIIGAMTDAGVSEEDAHVYAEGVRRGGTLVTAKVNEAHASIAEDILQRSRRVDLADRRRSYSESGWDRFDESATPYTPEQAREERNRYTNVL